MAVLEWAVIHAVSCPRFVPNPRTKARLAIIIRLSIGIDQVINGINRLSDTINQPIITLVGR